MGTVLCIKRIDRYVEENILEDLETGEVEFGSAREFLLELKKEVWRRRQRINKSGRIKKVGVGKKNHGRICAEIPKSS